LSNGHGDYKATSMTTYDTTIVQLKKMLTQLDRWLETARAHAEAKSFDPNLFLSSRLAPDQYALVRQVQSACDQAKFCAARLTGKEAPKHADTEQTMDEARARIRTCIAYLDTFTAADFEGVEKRLLALPFLEGKVITGADYVTQMILPNFYFHMTTAYAILRSNGVTLGKRDFLGGLSVRDPA